MDSINNKHNNYNCQCASCKAKRGEYKGKNNPNYGNHKLVGKNNPMYNRNHSEKTKRIISLVNSGSKNHFFKDGRTLKQYYCIDCKKEIHKSTHLYGTKRCRSCIVKYMFKIGKLNVSGKRNPMFGVHKFGKEASAYIHGKAYFPYPIEWNCSLREQIRKRDGYICQLCRKRNIENKSLHVHHIDYNKENCKEDNLVGLCHSCHERTNGNRDYYNLLLKNIVLNSQIQYLNYFKTGYTKKEE
jgi:hypothetical protein